MELSDVIKSLEDIKEQIYKRVPFNKYANTISKLNDVIAELKEVEYERLNDIITLHLQQNNSELISRCVLKQPENSSKTQTWKEFCEEENERRIKDLKKENERLREAIRKTNESERRIKDIEKETERLREEIRKTNDN